MTSMATANLPETEETEETEKKLRPLFKYTFNSLEDAINKNRLSIIRHMKKEILVEFLVTQERCTTFRECKIKSDETRTAWISRVLDFIVLRGRKMMYRFIEFLLEVGKRNFITNYMPSDKGVSEMNQLGRYVLRTLHNKRREVRQRTEANVMDLTTQRTQRSQSQEGGSGATDNTSGISYAYNPHAIGGGRGQGRNYKGTRLDEDIRKSCNQDSELSDKSDFVPCSVCLTLMRCVVCVPCKHMTCKACMINLVGQAGAEEKAKCPECRTPISKAFWVRQAHDSQSK